jgi:probable rRNA maturation factor
MIRFEALDISLPDFQQNPITSWITLIASTHGKTIGEINYVFCSDQKILDYNQLYLKHDYYTDIITFDYSAGEIISGDIYIGLETVLSNANKLQQDAQTELYRVIIHGILHLCGFKDKTPEDERIMHNQEDIALSLL